PDQSRAAPGYDPRAPAPDPEPHVTLNGTRSEAPSGIYNGWTGRITRLGWVASWKTVWCAARDSLSGATSVPVFGFRSKRGKLLELTSTRIRWPALNWYPAVRTSIVYSSGSFGTIGVD